MSVCVQYLDKENLNPHIKPQKPTIFSNDIIIWIDPNVNNQQNEKYKKELESLGFQKIKLYNNIEDSIKELITIRFEETYIIGSGSFFSQFINILKANLVNIYTIPKIIIFAFNKEKLITQENSKYINHPFYNMGGIEINLCFVTKFLTNKTMEKIERLQFLKVYKKNKKEKEKEKEGKQKVKENEKEKEKVIEEKKKEEEEKKTKKKKRGY